MPLCLRRAVQPRCFRSSEKVLPLPIPPLLRSPLMGHLGVFLRFPSARPRIQTMFRWLWERAPRPSKPTLVLSRSAPSIQQWTGVGASLLAPLVAPLRPTRVWRTLDFAISPLFKAPAVVESVGRPPHPCLGSKVLLSLFDPFAGFVSELNRFRRWFVRLSSSTCASRGRI